MKYMVFQRGITNKGTKKNLGPRWYFPRVLSGWWRTEKNHVDKDQRAQSDVTLVETNRCKHANDDHKSDG